MKEKYQKYLNTDLHFDKARWLGIFALIIVISGMFGWLYEFIFYYFNGGMKEFYWRGGNFLPWINIYATGALIIYFLTYKHRTKPLRVFLTGLISCGLLEFISGWGMYLIDHTRRCWDYNKEILNFGNIGGFICLRSVLFFGLSSLILIYIIVPFVFYLARKMTKKAFLIMSISLCSLILIDEFYNLFIARLFHLPRAHYFYKKIGFHYVKFK